MNIENIVNQAKGKSAYKKQEAVVAKKGTNVSIYLSPELLDIRQELNDKGGFGAFNKFLQEAILEKYEGKI